MKNKKSGMTAILALLLLLITSVASANDSGEVDLSNARVITVEAYAYSPQDPGMGKYTASGTLLRRGVIAVDPNYIPMGTSVYIPGYGVAVAEDIGWNIQGSTIDIAFDTHEEAIWLRNRNLPITQALFLCLKTYPFSTTVHRRQLQKHQQKRKYTKTQKEFPP